MIDLLLPILQARNKGVRGSSCVGRSTTNAPLIALLEQSKNVSEVSNALRAITGQDFGDEPEPWRQRLMQDPELRNAESIGILSDEDLVREAVQDLPVTLSGSSPAFIAQTSRWPSNGASRSGSISPARTRAVNLVADVQPRAF